MKTAEEIMQQAAENLGWQSFNSMLYCEESDVIENIVLDRIEQYADQFKPKWISVEGELPECNEHDESAYLQCNNELSGQFVGWYNSNNREWYASIYTASNAPIIVTHWQQLLEPPQVKS